MKSFMTGTYKFCWIVSTCFLFQCAMPTNGERSRASSDKKAAGGDNAQGKKPVESLDPYSEAAKTKVPAVAEKDQNATGGPSTEPAAKPMTLPSETPVAMPNPANPAPAPTTPPPAQNPMTPNGAYLVNLTCSDTMVLTVSLGGKSINRSITAPKSCAPLMTALNGETFPSGSASAEALAGGPTVKASCDNGTLNFSLMGVQGGASIDTILIFSLNNSQVCQEIRNVINGLKL